jgi:hypothetical protein
MAMFQDEAMFGNITSQRAYQMPKGKRPKAPLQMAREFSSMCSAR